MTANRILHSNIMAKLITFDMSNFFISAVLQLLNQCLLDGISVISVNIVTPTIRKKYASAILGF